jgi:ADP-ribosyltransferase exoenzyme
VVPLVVDPEALFAAGSAVAAAGGGLAADLTVLAAGVSAHTGLDVAGMVFGLGYQNAAESLLKAAAAAVNAARRVGAVIHQGAANYSRAEAASTLGGGGGALQPPPEPEKITAPGPPGTWGPGQPPPVLWALVQSFLDDVWPDGDVAGLRAAAERWRTFGAAAGAMSGALNASKALFDSQHLPEGGLIDDAVSQIGASMCRLGEGSLALAVSLDDFATQVAHAQNAIRDLLSELGSLTDLVHDVVLVLEGDAIDEIKKIARDIGAVQHNLEREAQAFEQGINLVMQLGDGLVVDFEKHIRRQLTDFLGEEVGNPVATVFDTLVNANEGMLKGAFGTVRGLAELDPRRFVIDPEGATETWKGMFRGSLVDIALHPEEGMEANLQNWRALLHLDDWSTARPGLGFGENVFDVASLFIPGVGEAGAVTDGAGAAARGAEAAADAAGAAERAGGRAAGEVGGLAAGRGALADIAKSGSGLVEDLDGIAGKVPKLEPPGGRPVGLPPGKPPEPPMEPAPRPPSGVPRGPSSAPVPKWEPPMASEDPHGPVEAPSPAAASPLAPLPAAAGEPVPSIISQPAEQPALHPSAAPSPSEPVPLPAHAPQPSPAAESLAHAPATGSAEPPIPRGSPQLPGHDGPPGAPKPPPGDGLHGPGYASDPLGSGQSNLPPHDAAPQEAGDKGGQHHGPADGSEHPSPGDPLHPNDLSALADYTGVGYRDLNDALRSNAVDASQHARVEAIKNALQKLPTHVGTVIRGTDLPPEVLAQYRPGEVITEKAFLSTTTDPAVARSTTFAGNVEFRILSTTGRDISFVSLFPGEREILFSAGTRFYVMEKTTDAITGRTIIEMIERPDHG